MPTLNMIQALNDAHKVMMARDDPALADRCVEHAGLAKLLL